MNQSPVITGQVCSLQGLLGGFHGVSSLVNPYLRLGCHPTPCRNQWFALWKQARATQPQRVKSNRMNWSDDRVIISTNGERTRNP
jgi:hypothetical protein